MRRRVHHDGFTILELTLALAMAAMLAASLYTAIWVAIRAKRGAVAACEPVRSASIASELMTQDLQSALPPTLQMTGSFIGTHEIGQAGGRFDNIDFFSVGGGDDGPEGVRHLNLPARSDVNPPVLVRQVKYNTLASLDQPATEEVLCRNLRSFQVQYYDGSGWIDDWDSTTVGDVLPAAVAITITTNNPYATDGKPISVTRVVPLACARPLNMTSMTNSTGGTP